VIGDVVLRCEGLTRSYGQGDNEVHALVDAALEVRSGELLVLRGPSGSGKTTLLNLLGGLDTPSAGRVWLGEREVTGATEAELIEMRRTDLGYIFQTFALLPVLSAAENVELPMRIAGVPPEQRDARVAELLEIVGLAEHANQRPNELSGGQQQRLGIARALANGPRLLIADEPTGQLDSTNAEAMMALIAALVHQRGVAAIVSTHDPRMAAHADRIIEIHDGRVGRRHGRHASDAEPDTAPVRVISDGTPAPVPPSPPAAPTPEPRPEG
jgi:putative ABC transport system ATP-binding protein